jgi:hypothetical protein
MFHGKYEYALLSYPPGAIVSLQQSYPVANAIVGPIFLDYSHHLAAVKFDSEFDCGFGSCLFLYGVAGSHAR